AAARLVRGRSIPALDRVVEPARAQAALRRAGAASGVRAPPLPGAEGSPESALPDGRCRREGGRMSPIRDPEGRAADGGTVTLEDTTTGVGASGRGARNGGRDGNSTRANGSGRGDGAGTTRRTV